MKKREQEPIVDLRMTNVGMSCDDFTLLMTAGPEGSQMPPRVQRKMDQHERACTYHSSKAFRQSVLGTPVTEQLEAAAMEVVQRLSAPRRGRF